MHSKGCLLLIQELKLTIRVVDGNDVGAGGGRVAGDIFGHCKEQRDVCQNDRSLSFKFWSSAPGP